MKSNLRKWMGVLTAIISYYLVHEGAHLIIALVLGIFQGIRFIGIIGMQILIDSSIPDFHIAVFSSAGAVSAIFTGYLLVLLRRFILHYKSKPLKAAAYYTTLGLLLIDPLYLSILYSFFGGGDMNGIILFGIPEAFVRLLFLAIGILNLILIAKVVYPSYKSNFAATTKQQ